MGKKPKIMRDSKGNRYIKHGRKNVKAPSGLTDTQFLKWLILHLKPKRKKRQLRAAPTFRDDKDPLDISPAQAQDEAHLRYVNIERERAGKTKLDAPETVGAPAKVSEEDIEERKKRKAERKRQREEEKTKLVDEKKAADTKALTEAKARTAAEHKAREIEEKHIKLGEEKRAGDVKTLEIAEDLAFRGVSQKELRDYVFFHHPNSKLNRESKSVIWAHLKKENSPLITQLIKKQMGTGLGNPERGMNSDEIDTVMKPYRPKYLGTIARDDWKQLTPAHTGKSGWIMNTDKLGQPGTHWVAFLMDLDGHTIEYYNSFADKLPADVLVSLKQFLEDNNPTKQYLKLKENFVVDQEANSTNCGWFACKFLIDRFRGRPWREVTKYDDHVKGENSVEKFKEQHGGSYNTYL